MPSQLPRGEPEESASTMAIEPILLTMSRTLDRDQIDFRVLARNAESNEGSSFDTEFAAIQLNRRICLSNGQIHTILHHGGPFSIDSELHDAVANVPSKQMGSLAVPDAPLAVFHRERTGLFSRRNLLIIETQPPRRFLLRRRSWFGSPANVDVVPLSDMPEDAATPLAAPVLLRAEKCGTVRQHLLARWMGPNELPAPVMLFVLNVLADLDRRAAVAASAGAVGL